MRSCNLAALALGAAQPFSVPHRAHSRQSEAMERSSHLRIVDAQASKPHVSKKGKKP